MDSTNSQFYLDLDTDLAKVTNGVFTFVIKINYGKVTDYVLMQNYDNHPKK